MSLLLVAATVAVAVGAALQSATGFGFALIAAPLTFAAMTPAHAVGTLLVLGAEMAILILVTEGRRPRPLARSVVAICGWSVPGAVAGVVALRQLSPLALQIGVTLGVVATLAIRRLPRRDLYVPGWAAGLAAGALTTTTSVNGPPMLLHLLGRGHTPVAVRDTLTACFLGLAAVGAIALVATGTDAVPPAHALALFVPAVLVGQLAGRRSFARLAASDRYESVLTGVLLVAIVAGLVGVLV